MAKSARATVSKRNSVIRRDTVHKPVEDDRLQRLSEKLLAIAEAEIPTDSTNPVKKTDHMEIVDEAQKTASTSSTYKKRAAKGKIPRNRHARNAVTFPSLRKHPGKKGKKKA
ncbi:hypothetical protein K440DRAFT_660208 [Wilcoxina mikolae CBS 423.85]|nr:hypothetical protein K440DRAFT_660208 [Wilcoxina mikolae CBS 423.85]